MPSDNFWKKVVVFSITLLLGFLSAELSSANKKADTENDIPKISTTKETSVLFPPSKNPNCVSADENLKYQNLPFDKNDKNYNFRNLPYLPEEHAYNRKEINRLFHLNDRILKLKSFLEDLEKYNAKEKPDILVKKIQKKVRLEIDSLESELKLGEKLLPRSEYFQEQNLLYLEKCSDK